MNELLECPFCGNNVSIVFTQKIHHDSFHAGTPGYYIQHSPTSPCPIEFTGKYDTKELAIAAWNKQDNLGFNHDDMDRAFNDGRRSAFKEGFEIIIDPKDVDRMINQFTQHGSCIIAIKDGELLVDHLTRTVEEND